MNYVRLFNFKSESLLADKEIPWSSEAMSHEGDEYEDSSLHLHCDPASPEEVIESLLDSLLGECVPPVLVPRLVQCDEAEAGVSTPDDLPRIKCRPPVHPVKSLLSPPPTDGQLAKRSLFDSPAVTQSKPSGFQHYRRSSALLEVDTPVKLTSETPFKLTSDTPVKLTSDTPKSVKFSEKSPVRISPKPFLDTQTSTDVEYLLMKIRSMKVDEPEDETKRKLDEPELSFALPASLDLPELSPDSLSQSDTFGDLIPINPSDCERSVLASHGGDFNLRPRGSNLVTNPTCSSALTTLALQHQAELLEKDKEIAAVQKKISEKEIEEIQILEEIRKTDEGNATLGVIVSQFEEIMDQIHKENKKEIGGLCESKAKASKDYTDAQADLQVNIFYFEAVT